jgi:hypothetical protein
VKLKKIVEMKRNQTYLYKNNHDILTHTPPPPKKKWGKKKFPVPGIEPEPPGW